MTMRHAHRPWRLSRYLEQTNPTERVIVALRSARCPHCPQCGGDGGWWTASGPHGDDDPDWWECDKCRRPLATVRYPGWLDRALPRSLLRRADRCVDTGPPF
ncbi:hypothetical protein [Nocardia asiatica]|uniref:hypothetical protein n=1 Tax=Nocardia asiatica TaxID=209252 RepID=UPI00031FCF06|nr:hypothetical protein [Nocardia asiatica]